MTEQAAEEITARLEEWRAGDPDAADRVFALVYDELRIIARSALSNQRREATLDTNGLVHEVYLRLTARFRPNKADRRAFYATAAKAMRRILVDRARQRLAIKRGGGATRVELGDLADPLQANAELALALDQALDSLAQVDGRLAELVELRFYAGCSNEEISKTLDLSERTVRRDWLKARALLADSLASRTESRV